MTDFWKRVAPQPSLWWVLALAIVSVVASASDSDALRRLQPAVSIVGGFYAASGIIGALGVSAALRKAGGAPHALESGVAKWAYGWRTNWIPWRMGIAGVFAWGHHPLIAIGMLCCDLYLLFILKRLIGALIKSHAENSQCPN